MKSACQTILVLACLLASCTDNNPHYIIGVSQCSEDIWRNKLNEEMRMGTYAYENTELNIVSANDDSQRQIEQINQFVDQKVDLLIISPNQLSTISPAIERAYEADIPVILFDRKTDSPHYTAFIGADNYEMGRALGNYIATQLDGKGNIIEIEGLKGSSPAIERHNGFLHAISQYPRLNIVASLEGDWTEESGKRAMETFIDAQKTGQQAGHHEAERKIDFVFGQNDRMAIGARKALIDKQMLTSDIRFAGIDGLASKGGGLELVSEGVLTASYIYPTAGDRVIELAMDILQNQPFEKDNYLQSALVTRDNASVLLMQAKEINRQAKNLRAIHEQAAHYLSTYTLQRIVMILLGTTVLLLAGSAYFLIRVNRSKTRLNRQLTQRNEEFRQQQEELEKNLEQKRKLANEIKLISKTQTPLVAKLRKIISEHLEDPAFNVNELASEMAMSRVQLYRKIKAQTGLTIIELIRNVRLEKARDLFENTDYNVSQVAGMTGFTTLQYFIKCFKDEYGVTPYEYIKTTEK